MNSIQFQPKFQSMKPQQLQHVRFGSDDDSKNGSSSKPSNSKGKLNFIEQFKKGIANTLEELVEAGKLDFVDDWLNKLPEGVQDVIEDVVDGALDWIEDYEDRENVPNASGKRELPRLPDELEERGRMMEKRGIGKALEDLQWSDDD